MMTAASPPKMGMLIVVEGIDGTGKTTLVAALADRLAERGEAVVRSYEPTSGEFGRKIRDLAAHGREGITPEQEADLFREDRREHVRDVIAPALAAGKTVLLDRYYYSTVAYQGARGLDPKKIEADNRAFAPEPDLLVLLDLPVADALQRITQKRGTAPDYFEGAPYLARVREIFGSVRHPNLLRLDASLTTESLVSIILQHLVES